MNEFLKHFSLIVVFYILNIFLCENILLSQTTIKDGSTENIDFPMDCNYRYNYAEFIYLQSEIATQGDITEIYFEYDGYEAFTETIKIFIGHTSKVDFTSSTDWVTSVGMTEVYSGDYSVSNSYGWYGITLDTPFSYNNTDNLVIGFYEGTYEYHSSSADFYSISTGAANHRAIYYDDDSSIPNPASPPTADGTWYYVPSLQLSIVEPLPIRLVNFEGKLQDNQILLTWKTASEKNNDYFTIEKTLDGNKYEKVGIVKSKGNSFVSNDYLFYDLAIPDEIIYYRLKQTDFDGKASFSKLISVDNRDYENKVVGVYNVLGQEVNQDYNGMVIVLFDDGSTVKKIQ